MLDDPGDLAALTALETTLSGLCAELADILADPPSDERTDKVRLLWPRLASLEIPYSSALSALRSNLSQPRDDTPLQAAARRRLLHHAPARLGLWGRIGRMVHRQLHPGSFPALVTETTEIITGPQFGAVNYLSQLLFQLSNPIAGDADVVPEDHHRDIPLSGAYFINLLTAARRILLARGHDGPVRFLDMGCGAGTKVLAASAVFEIAHGGEYSPKYVAQARSFFTRLGADPDVILETNALTFDDYASYDVIYFYRPLKNIDLAVQMEERILDQARPGTLLIAPLNVTLGRLPDRVLKIADKIFITGQTRDAIAELVRDAERKGCETRITPFPEDEVLGFWQPLVTRSRRNGFALL